MSLKRWNGSSWVVVAGSRPGQTGAQGPTGPTGPAGTVSIGTTTVTTAGNPASVSNTGTYGNAVLNFIIPQGPTGPQGTTGIAGTRGTIIGSAQTDPVTFGVTGMINGDGFLNLSNGYYYVYSSGSSTWVLQGSLMGPAGVHGATGPTGLTGPTGPTASYVVNTLQTQYNYWATDQILNLGIYYPKYENYVTLNTNNAHILALSLAV